MQLETSTVIEDFDAGLWKAGVADGAFSGLRDPAARWFTLEAGGRKVALASAVPGPGELTSISYFVLNDARGKGYATALASDVADRFEKASFLVMKSNDASVKVALKALRDKLSMVMGRAAVRLTKEADAIPGGKADKKKPSDFDPAALAEGTKHELEHTSDPAIAREIAQDHLAEDPAYYEKLKKIEKKASHGQRGTVGSTLEGKLHESFSVAADRMHQAGLMSTRERIELSRSVGQALERFRRSVNKHVSSRELTDRAHDLLKGADEIAAAPAIASAHAAPPPYLAAHGQVLSPELRRKRALKVAHELLKDATSRKTLARVLEVRGRQLLRGLKPEALEAKAVGAAQRVARVPDVPASAREVRDVLRASRFTQGVRPGKGGDFYKAIRKAEQRQSQQPDIPGMESKR